MGLDRAYGCVGKWPPQLRAVSIDVYSLHKYTGKGGLIDSNSIPYSVLLHTDVRKMPSLSLFFFFIFVVILILRLHPQRSGWTALMLAARSMNLDIVEYLIRHGADIKARSSNHQTVYGLGDRVLVGKAIQRGLEARSKMNKRIKKEEEQHHARGEEQGEGKGQATNSRKPLLQWNEDDVRLWLKAVGCSKVEKAFEENMVDGEWLLDMNEQALDELGIGDEKVRSKLKLEISRLILGPD
mmetsp:Transcript_6243/g.10341  ORF Transcript_6243/g.10341 Transcript_6243/m.10341 type:complete len:240 (-) Transcript_6243:132-851(-)